MPEAEEVLILDQAALLRLNLDAEAVVLVPNIRCQVKIQTG